MIRFSTILLFILSTGCTRIKNDTEQLVLTDSVKCELPSTFTIDSVQVDTVNLNLGDLSDFYFKDDYLIIQNSKGKLIRFKPSDTKPLKTTLTNDIDNFTIGDDQEIYYSKKGQVYKLNSDRSVRIAKVDSLIRFLRVNSSGDKFAVTDWGIVELNTGKLFFPDSLPNDPFTYDEFWYRPSCVFFDSHDNLWIGFDYGEWGGNIISFNTKTKQFNPVDFDTLKLGAMPIKSLFEGSDNIIYATSGMMHFDAGGAILSIQKFKTRLIYDKMLRYTDVNDSTIGEYIGPGVFNFDNQSVIYYSNLGFHQGRLSGDKFCTVTFLHQQLKWKFGQEMAVGYDMNVKKMMIMEGGMIFLSTNNGIGYLKGNELTYFK